MRVLNPRTSWRSFLSATRRAQTGRASSTLTDTFDEPMSGSSKVKIFDRDLKRKQRDRAAWLMNPADTFVDTVAENLLDRLEDCRKSFPTALCLGGSLIAVRRLLNGRGGIEKLIMMDTSYDMVKICKENEEMSDNIETSYLVGDEEFLPVKESSLDLVISCLGLHWTNDLPGALIQSRLALKPDGLFLGAILGGQTLKLFIWFIYRFPSIMLLFLHYIIMLLPLKNVSLCFSTSHQVLCCLFVRELRIACTLAHMEREGGISPRLSPLAQVRDAGNLLTRAGFSLPGVDADEYTVKYKDAFQLIEHLRAMGETNALVQRNTVLSRDTALATAAIYQSMFGEEDGTVPATYQVIYMTGWREHPSHQKARARGSATISFQDIQKQLGNEQ